MKLIPKGSNGIIIDGNLFFAIEKKHEFPCDTCEYCVYCTDVCLADRLLHLTNCKGMFLSTDIVGKGGFRKYIRKILTLFRPEWVELLKKEEALNLFIEQFYQCLKDNDPYLKNGGKRLTNKRIELWKDAIISCIVELPLHKVVESDIMNKEWRKYWREVSGKL